MFLYYTCTGLEMSFIATICICKHYKYSFLYFGFILILDLFLNQQWESYFIKTERIEMPCAQ